MRNSRWAYAALVLVVGLQLEALGFLAYVAWQEFQEQRLPLKQPPVAATL